MIRNLQEVAQQLAHLAERTPSVPTKGEDLEGSDLNPLLSVKSMGRLS